MIKIKSELQCGLGTENNRLSVTVTGAVRKNFKYDFKLLFITEIDNATSRKNFTSSCVIHVTTPKCNQSIIEPISATSLQNNNSFNIYTQRECLVAYFIL